MKAFPKRYKQWSVGKSIGGCVYLHRDYTIEAVPAKYFEPLYQCWCQDMHQRYDVMKINLKTGALTLIWCDNFDGLDEPAIVKTLLIRADGTHKKTVYNPDKDPWIYHHKWLMVRDDYTGFNVEESKERSRSWLALPGVDSSRIGKRSYWEEHVVPVLEEEPVG